MIIGNLVYFAQGDSQSKHTIGLILDVEEHTITFSNGTQQRYRTFHVLWNTGEVLTCYRDNLRMIQ